MANWAFYKSLDGTKPAGTKDIEMDPSLTFAGGDPLILSAQGRLKKTAAKTDSPEYVATGAATSTATGEEKANVVEIGHGRFIWKMPFSPLYEKSVAKAGGSTTTVVLGSAPENYSNNDWVGGTIFCHDTGETRTIIGSDNPTAGNDLTLTVLKPFSQASDGLKFSATPLGRDISAGKLDGTNYAEPSQVIADLTGGKLRITDGDGGGIDLFQKLAYCVVMP